LLNRVGASGGESRIKRRVEERHEHKANPESNNQKGEKKKRFQMIDPDCKSTLQPENTSDEPHVFLESEF